MDYTGHHGTSDRNRTGHNPGTDKNDRNDRNGPDSSRARAHMLKRKADTPDPKWIALQQADREALKALHKRIKNPAHDLTTDEITLLTRVKACHTCGSHNHSTTDCYKNQATTTTA